MGCTWNKICVSDPLPDVELVAVDQLGPALTTMMKAVRFDAKIPPCRTRCTASVAYNSTKAMVDTPILMTVLQKHRC